MNPSLKAVISSSTGEYLAVSTGGLFLISNPSSTLTMLNFFQGSTYSTVGSAFTGWLEAQSGEATGNTSPTVYGFIRLVLLAPPI